MLVLDALVGRVNLFQLGGFRGADSLQFGLQPQLDGVDRQRRAGARTGVVLVAEHEDGERIRADVLVDEDIVEQHGGLSRRRIEGRYIKHEDDAARARDVGIDGAGADSRVAGDVDPAVGLGRRRRREDGLVDLHGRHAREGLHVGRRGVLQGFEQGRLSR